MIEQYLSPAHVFQSLFYWNGLLRLIAWAKQYGRRFRVSGFNPCSIGMVF